jgi:hypothetical protein
VVDDLDVDFRACHALDTFAVCDELSYDIGVVESQCSTAMEISVVLLPVVIDR